MAKDEDDSHSRGPGCLTIVFLVGLALVGTGGYLLGRWEALPGYGKAGSVVLVVIGTVMMLPMILIWGAQIFLRTLFSRLKGQLEKAGSEIFDDTQRMYGQIHEFREAEEEDFDGLDEAYYRNTERQLSGLGYCKLGDVVDATIEEIKGMATPIRLMASPDGTVTAAFYHLVNENAADDDDEDEDDGSAEREPATKLLMCDLSTEFSDGAFQLTANTGGLDLMTPPPRFARRQFPLQTPITELLAAHEAEKQKQLAVKGGVTCVVINTLEEALESEKRQQAAKNEFRKQIGFVDPEEVRRIGANMEDGERVGDLMAKAVEEEKRKRAVGNHE